MCIIETQRIACNENTRMEVLWTGGHNIAKRSHAAAIRGGKSHIIGKKVVFHISPPEPQHAEHARWQRAPAAQPTFLIIDFTIVHSSISEIIPIWKYVAQAPTGFWPKVL